MADEADMRNELADLQTRADQIADEVRERMWEGPINAPELEMVPAL